MDRMPTDSERAQLVAALLGYLPGNTQQQRLNYLQDSSKTLGFDPFGQPFQPEPFPEYEFRSPTRDIYATDAESPYISMFSNIDRGVNPVNAARQAIKDGDFGTNVDADYESDILRTAKDYAKEMRSFKIEQQKWEKEQRRLASKAPVTLQEILSPSSMLETIGASLGVPLNTAEDLANLYAATRMSRVSEADRMKTAEGAQPVEGGTGAPGFRDVARGAADFGRRQLSRIPGAQNLPMLRNPVPLNPLAGLETGLRAVGSTGGGAPEVAPMVEKTLQDFMPGQGTDPRSLAKREGFKRATESVYSRLSDKPVWSPAAQNVMRNLAYMNFLSGGQQG
jgi:hypothetical protein